MVQSAVTIVIPWQQSTGSQHDYLFCYCPLVGILFAVLRIEILFKGFKYIIYQPKFEKVTYGKNSFKYYGAHIWNLLPNEIKDTADILSFKSLIMT